MAFVQDTTFESNEQDIREKLLKELHSVKVLINNNEAYFNFVSDPDLTEYAVYENRALLARYSYLIKAIRLIDNGIPDAHDNDFETAAI